MEYWLAWFHAGNTHTKAVAQAAERLGFAGIAVPDHVAIPRDYQSVHPSGRRVIEHDTPYPDALITIATMAAVTTTLEFMTYVYVLPMRDPFSVAKQAATLAMLSDYRLALGVGAGWNVEEIELLGHDPRSRGKRMDEMLSIIRDFWDDGIAEFRGAHYKFGPAGQFPVPERRIPIWMGGKSDIALKRAARHDGWLGMNYPMEEIQTLLVKLDRERQRHLDRCGGGDQPFRRYVIPEAMPSKAVYGQLEDWGIDGTVVMAWPVDDPAYASLDAKLEAMERFADVHIEG
jgi:probable F420-dependent oxidoreductase